MVTVEVKAVVKYFCKKGMSSTEIHYHFITCKTLWDDAPSYSTVKKWAAEFKRWRESVENYVWSGSPKEATTDTNVELVDILIMLIREEACVIQLDKYAKVSGQFSLS